MVRVMKCDVCGKPARRGRQVGSIYTCESCLALAKQGLEDRPLFRDRIKRKPPPNFKGKKPTQEQQEILDFLLGGFEVLMIEAGAGTGKTSQLEMIAQVLPGNGQYTAFNTALVADSEPKFKGTRVACNTTHSLAFRARGKEYAHRLNGNRVKATEIAKMLNLGELNLTLGNADGEEITKRLSPGFLASHVMLAIKKFCQSADFEIMVSHFRYIDGIDVPKEDGSRTYTNNQRLREHLLPYAQRAWKDLSNIEGTLPFSHDHYVKIWQLDSPIISADYIMLDEAQDTAPVMLDILRQQTCPIILVGDSAQQIYEWRGAVNALATFPGAPRMYLSQSFRFGQAVADVANMILEELQEPTQLRLKGSPTIPSRLGELEDPTAILCRTNGAAVAHLLGAMANGKKPFLVGGGADVIAFVRAACDLQNGRPTNHPDLACFSDWAEVQEYSKLDEGEDLKLMVKLIDKFGADIILEALKNMPKEKDADLVISTAHKSKGRQWERVQLAADFPTRDKCGDPERKLLYVAVTRAQLVLDISACPYFTGEGSLDVSDVIANQPSPDAEQVSIIPPAPSDEPKAGDFTWSRYKKEDIWVIRGPRGMAGKMVEVVRKDGSTSNKMLGAVAMEDDAFAFYRVS